MKLFKCYVKQLSFRYIVALFVLSIISLFMGGCLNPFGANSSVVWGTVTDNNGIPVSGASIKAQKFIRGSDLSEWRDFRETTTNADGIYKITLPAGLQLTKLTASKSGLLDASVELPGLGGSSYTMDITMSGAGTITGPWVKPNTASHSEAVEIKLGVTCTSPMSPDQMKLKVHCYDTNNHIAAAIPLKLHPEESISPALFVNDIQLDSSMLEPGVYKLVFTGIDGNGISTNTITTSLTVVD